MKNFKIIVDEYSSKSTMKKFIYIMLNLFVFCFLIMEIVHRDIKHIFLCILTLIMFLIPSILHRKLRIVFPTILEIMIYILIFSSLILGEVLGLYVYVKFFDIIIHLLYGFLMTSIGFSIINISKYNLKLKLRLASKYLVLFCFCFGMTSGVIWELFEYTIDKVFEQDMQKDAIVMKINSVLINEIVSNKVVSVDINNFIINSEDYTLKYGGYIDIGLNDTMKDILVNMIGCSFFSIICYTYLINKSKIAKYFIIIKDIK